MLGNQNGDITHCNIVYCPQYHYLINRKQAELLINSNLYELNNHNYVSNKTAVEKDIINNILNEFFKYKNKQELCYFVSYMISQDSIKVVNRSIEAHLKHLGEPYEQDCRKQSMSEYRQRVSTRAEDRKTASELGSRAGFFARILFETMGDEIKKKSVNKNKEEKDAN